MKIKYAIFNFTNQESRICFSREELLFMINSLNQNNDPNEKYLLIFLEELEKTLIEETR